MKNLLSFIIDAIVDNPEGVTISEQSAEDGSLTINLRVAPLDMGKVIGKQGATIRAVRTLLRAKAAKVGTHVFLNLEDATTNQPEEGKGTP